MKSIKHLTLLAALTVPFSLHAATDAVDDGISSIQQRWAQITYHVADDQGKDDAYTALESDAEQLVATFPERAEPKIWQGIVLSTHAGVDGGLGALKKVKTARTLFEEAIAIDDAALRGSAHTSLGSLYYQVPRWPLAFGSKKKAEQHLTAALRINPKGIDPNYFFGDYLFEQGRYDEAMRALETALSAPDRSERPLADAGRRQEIRALMDKIRKKLAG